jgi:hypothetical protein
MVDCLDMIHRTNSGWWIMSRKSIIVLIYNRHEILNRIHSEEYLKPTTKRKKRKKYFIMSLLHPTSCVNQQVYRYLARWSPVIPSTNLAMLECTSQIVKNGLTRWSGVLIDNLIVVQIVETFLVWYGTRMFDAVFTKAFYWTQSWSRWIRSTYSNAISLRYVSVLFSHLRPSLLNSLFILGFHILCPLLIFPIGATF